MFLSNLNANYSLKISAVILMLHSARCRAWHALKQVGLLILLLASIRNTYTDRQTQILKFSRCERNESLNQLNTDLTFQVLANISTISESACFHNSFSKKKLN
jgi:hypothetical protein